MALQLGSCGEFRKSGGWIGASGRRDRFIASLRDQSEAQQLFIFATPPPRDHLDLIKSHST